jgi:membrane-associated phospholipid phosphatase
LLDRRRFVRRLGTGAAAAALGAAGLSTPCADAATGEDDPPRWLCSDRGPLEVTRAGRSYRARVNAASFARRRPDVTQSPNSDEDRFPNRIASYTKGLPHDALGQVDPAAYQTLLTALASGLPDDFERIRLGIGRKLTSPQAGLAFDLEGADSEHLSIPAAPQFDSAEIAGEAAELYWMALLRDVNFTDYESDPGAANAASDLSRYSVFRGPKSGANVTSASLFRGNTPGDLIGPWLSQFLLQDIHFGALTVPQRINTVVSRRDYMTTFTDWAAVQSGANTAGSDVFDSTPRYMRNLRDLAQWVHVDALYQAYLQAALILLGAGAPLSPGLPPVKSLTQIGFAEFGGPHILSMLTEVATRALKAVWYQKWFVHRHLRPEEYGGRVHLQKTGGASYPLHSEILSSPVLDAVHRAYGSYLLPMAFPEGSPTHPSYGAGHATVAGACTTMVKAFFDESFVIPNPVVPNSDGTGLVPYSGPALTAGNELDKVAANVAIGRNGAGVHWRSDYAESVLLGEAVAITVLQEQKACYNQQDFVWTLTKFDGSTITI